MKKQIVGILAVGGVMILGGCQNLEEQMGAKLAESLINSASNGEVKVNIKDLENGKFDLVTKDGTMSIDGSNGGDGGSLKITDANGTTTMETSGDGESFVVRDESGKEVMKADKNSLQITDKDGKVSTMTGGDGETRPAEAASDLPSPASARDFSYFNSDALTSLSYKLPEGDLKGHCDEVRALVAAAGWQTADGFNFDSEDNMSSSYKKENYTLLLSCSLTDGVPDIALSKMPNSN